MNKINNDSPIDLIEKEIELLKNKKQKLEEKEKQNLNDLMKVIKKKHKIENKKLEQNFSTCSKISTKKSRKGSVYSSKITQKNKSPNHLINSVQNSKRNMFRNSKNKINEYNYEIDLPFHLSKNSLMYFYNWLDQIKVVQYQIIKNLIQNLLYL